MNLQELLAKYENRSNNNNFNRPNFFQLKDDGDSAMVKILISNETELQSFVREVHTVKVNGYDNKVLCLGEGTCKCCEAGMTPKLVLMLPLYNETTKRVEFWQRGITTIKDLRTMIAEYGDLSQETFKIVRSGKAKSKDTKYSMVYSKKQIDCNIADLKIPQIVGRDFKLVLGLSPEQQQEAIIEGKVTWTSTKEEPQIAKDEDAF